MKKYQIQITYTGNMILEILAYNEAQAKKYAHEEIGNMNDKEYLENLNLEIYDEDVTEIEDLT